ncbi:MAG: transcriptional repressor LexA [Armatimonadetes bacterium]|nr:transcriptional repressor LexA [Armatimonadota bacterium]
MTKGLTDKQERILNFIVDYVSEHGYPPSIREIGNCFGISSLRGVTVHLDALERKGFIKRASTSRSITVVGRTGGGAPSRNASFLPLVGTIAAGTPITATENIEGFVPVPPDIVRNQEGAFVLRVRGDSMIDDHIMPRDLVIIRPQETAQNGDMVAVLLGDEATVKRIQFVNGRVRLMPANPAYQPIEVNREDSRVIGKVIGLIRSYQPISFS